MTNYVLLVARGYPNERYSMNGIFEFDQARALSEAGQKVVFVAVDLRSLRRWRKWGVEHFIKDGVEVYAVNIPLGRVPHSILLSAGKLGLRALYRLIQREHGCPDIVHAHFLDIAEIALTLKTKLKATKFVVTEHWSLLNEKYSTFPKWVKDCAYHIYDQYDKVICVSPMLANSIKTLFKIKNVVVIPNMIDPLFLSGARILHETFEFIFVGEIDVRKCPLECIQAFYNAFHENNFTTTKGHKIRLRLIGNGPLFHECQERIRELKLENNVCMMGQMTRDRIADILRASDCFVLPSKSETFGVVYVEAMACGLPVIATKCGGPEFFVNDENGLLIQANAQGQLVRAMRAMVNDIKKYDHISIMMKTKDNFSPVVIANKLVKLYRTILRCASCHSN